MELNIPLVELADAPPPDITVDGADEVSDDLQLIKGLGGALLREKIVAQNSRRLVIIADASKRVARLGTHAPLPVEVALFAHRAQEPFLRKLGCEPVLRLAGSGAPFQTDNGNCIYDCRFPNGIDRPHDLQQALRQRAGVVETGLFLDLAADALIADTDQVIHLSR
jgi:ribose 5-phosphate isomerase A